MKKGLYLIKKLGHIHLYYFITLCLLLFPGYQLYANAGLIKDMHAIDQQEPIILGGKVINHDEVVVVGVLVIDNATENSTFTDDKGKFRLILNEPSYVSFAQIGYQTLNYKFSETDTSLVVMLSPETNELIVEGFNSVENIKNRAEITLDPLDSMEIVSIESLQTPLYIIDDVEMEPGSDLNNLDVKYIESISVLKNKSATDLYGNRGKNGVVIVTTTPQYKMGYPKSFKMTKIDTSTVIKKEVE